MKGRHGLTVAFPLLLAAQLGWCTPASANLLTNGSFETGDFTGWTTGGSFDSGSTLVVSGPNYFYSGAEDGDFYVVSGAYGSDATLSQTFSDTSGSALHLSGWLNACGGFGFGSNSPSDFSMLFNGTAFVSQSDPYTGGDCSGFGTSDSWQAFSFDATATGSDTFTLSFRDDPGFIAIDNFDITEVAPVPTPAPEPATLSLFGAALLGLPRLRRRSRSG